MYVSRDDVLGCNERPRLGRPILLLTVKSPNAHPETRKAAIKSGEKFLRDFIGFDLLDSPGGASEAAGA